MTSKQLSLQIQSPTQKTLSKNPQSNTKSDRTREATSLRSRTPSSQTARTIYKRDPSNLTNISEISSSASVLERAKSILQKLHVISPTNEIQNQKNVLFEQKLKELTQEIQKYTIENANIQKLKQELIKKSKLLQEQINRQSKLENAPSQEENFNVINLENEINNFNQWKQKEMEKIEEQKKIFLRNHAINYEQTRQRDQKQIQALQKQIQSFKEQINREKLNSTVQNQKQQNQINQILNEKQENLKLITKFKLENQKQKEKIDKLQTKLKQVSQKGYYSENQTQNDQQNIQFSSQNLELSQQDKSLQSLQQINDLTDAFEIQQKAYQNKQVVKEQKGQQQVQQKQQKIQLSKQAKTLFTEKSSSKGQQNDSITNMLEISSPHQSLISQVQNKNDLQKLVKNQETPQTQQKNQKNYPSFLKSDTKEIQEVLNQITDNDTQNYKNRQTIQTVSEMDNQKQQKPSQANIEVLEQLNQLKFQQTEKKQNYQNLKSQDNNQTQQKSQQKQQQNSQSNNQKEVQKNIQKTNQKAENIKQIENKQEDKQKNKQIQQDKIYQQIQKDEKLFSYTQNIQNLNKFKSEKNIQNNLFNSNPIQRHYSADFEVNQLAYVIEESKKEFDYNHNSHSVKMEDSNQYSQGEDQKLETPKSIKQLQYQQAKKQTSKEQDTENYEDNSSKNQSQQEQQQQNKNNNERYFKQKTTDGQQLIRYKNGDIKQISPNDTQAVMTTFQDGTKIIQFPNGQEEKHFKDGTKQIKYPDQTIKIVSQNEEVTQFLDGTVKRKDLINNVQILEYPNGRKDYLFPDESIVQQFPNGVIKRISKDKQVLTSFIDHQ